MDTSLTSEPALPVPWRRALLRALILQAVLVGFLLFVLFTAKGADNPLPWIAILVLQFPGSLLLFAFWQLGPWMLVPIVLFQSWLLVLLFKKPWRRPV